METKRRRRALGGESNTNQTNQQSNCALTNAVRDAENKLWQRGHHCWYQRRHRRGLGGHPPAPSSNRPVQSWHRLIRRNHFLLRSGQHALDDFVQHVLLGLSADVKPVGQQPGDSWCRRGRWWRGWRRCKRNRDGDGHQRYRRGRRINNRRAEEPPHRIRSSDGNVVSGRWHPRRWQREGNRDREGEVRRWRWRWRGRKVKGWS